ncbi:MAG: hypothetical protein JXP34_09495 [Planctomycetes bacterium]|nr:hypothetical protein [Planctomycetota bacterium]
MERGSASRPIERLGRLRHAFGAEAARGKLEALRAIAGRRLRTAGQVRKLHALLCFLIAHPDDEEIFRTAGTLLDGLAARIRALPRAHRARLDDSGIEGTRLRFDASYGVTDVLVRSHGANVEIDWRRYAGAEALDPILLRSVSPSEEQVFIDGEVTTREWVRRAKGDLPVSDLSWVWAQMERAIGPRPLREILYEHAEVPLVWHLAGDRGSMGANRRAIEAPFCHPDGIARPRGDGRRAIEKPLDAIRLLSRVEGAEAIRMTIAALAPRRRELYPAACGNPDDVYEADVGRGARVILIGLSPASRLPLEGDYGYLILKNGMPVGYGGASPLFHQANTGIHIFEEHRGGESAFLFIQTLRVFRALLGCTRFIVSPYQAGLGNRDAIASGAYWFYDRIGFRPADPEIRAIADRERARLAARRGARTGEDVLRKLAQNDLELRLRGARREQAFAEEWLGVLAAGATRILAAERCSRRADAMARIARRVAADLGAAGMRRWPEGERRAFEGLAPLAALVRGLRGWPAGEKRALVRLMRAKGARREFEYVEALREHDAFRRALARYCREAERRGS